jgi:outer membrane lipoprotein SlyB
MRNVLLALAAGSLAVPATLALPTTAAEARDHGKHHKARRYYKSSNGVRYWRGNDGRYHCHRSDGTVGLIIGAAGGALVGRAVDTHGERATGTVLGAAAGALLGRSVARNNVRCR